MTTAVAAGAVDAVQPVALNDATGIETRSPVVVQPNTSEPFAASATNDNIVLPLVTVHVATAVAPGTSTATVVPAATSSVVPA